MWIVAGCNLSAFGQISKHNSTRRICFWNSTSFCICISWPPQTGLRIQVIFRSRGRLYKAIWSTLILHLQPMPSLTHIRLHHALLSHWRIHERMVNRWSNTHGGPLQAPCSTRLALCSIIADSMQPYAGSVQHDAASSSSDESASNKFLTLQTFPSVSLCCFSISSWCVIACSAWTIDICVLCT